MSPSHLLCVLDFASANKFTKIAEKLLNAKANPNILNSANSTPLRKFFALNLSSFLNFHYFSTDWAAYSGAKEIVEMLLEANADANIKNECGKIAFEEALQGSHREIAEILAKVSKLEEDRTYSTFSEENNKNDDGE